MLNELGAAAFAVTQVDSKEVPESALAPLARQYGVRVVVRLDAADGPSEAVVYVVSSSGTESTLRRLAPRARGERDSQGVLALRIVEVINAAFQEMDRVPSQQARPRPVAPPAAARRSTNTATIFSVRAGGGLVWLPTASPVLLGPELALRIRKPPGFFGEARGYISATSASYARSSGSADVRMGLLSFKLGYGRLFADRWEWAAALGASGLGAWADASPNAGYRERQGFARAALLHGGAELSFKLTPGSQVVGGVTAGRLVPRFELDMAGASVAQASWLTSASLALALQWGP